MSYTQLTEIERYQIYALLKQGLSNKKIADALKRHPATIGREIKRNTGLKGYRPQQAQRLADERKTIHCTSRLPDSVWTQVKQLLKKYWSPEQVSGWLKKEKKANISHEWIYQYILADKRGGGDLYTYLRCQKKRKKRYGKPDTRGQIKNRISIDDRPKVVEKRCRIGDWEVDTVIGQQGGSVLVTIAERKSMYSVVALSENKTSEAVKDAIVEALSPLAAKVKTMTYDNGREFALHEVISDQLNAKGYFAHPYHSWERGLNENMNGLIRQFAPKGSDFNLLTENDVEYIMSQLNNRPRKRLGYKTPNEVMFGIKPMIALAS